MRIAMLTNNYKPYIGGVPVSIEHLAAALRERGHVVYVFAPTYENQEEEEYVIRYPSFPVRIVGAPVPNVCTGIIGEKMQELGIEVIHVHHPAIVGNVALALRQRFGIPVVFTYHTRYEEYLHYISGLKQLEEYTGVFDKYLRYFCGKCDLLFAPTPGMREYLVQKGMQTPIEVLPTGIPGENFYPKKVWADALRERYLGGADYLLITVSRLAKEKNLRFQMEGLTCLKRLLKKKGRTFRHLIIGDGPDREELCRAAAELGLSREVLFIGNVDNREVGNYCAAADAFVFTSKSETQGIVLLEAMASGLPVIAVDGSGVCDIIVHGKNGYLTDEDAHSWAVHIKECLMDEGGRNAMRQAARETAERYSEESVAKWAERYYREVIVKYHRMTLPASNYGILS